jgi:hypothetical protein
MKEQAMNTDLTTRSTSLLWKGAALTAIAALLFPRLHHVIHEDGAIWQFDSEAKVLAPLVVVVAFALFAAIGYPLWRARGNGIAIGSLVLGVLSIAAVVAFWISAPIMLGGIAVTLGLEALDRQATRARQRSPASRSARSRSPATPRSGSPTAYGDTAPYARMGVASKRLGGRSGVWQHQQNGRLPRARPELPGAARRDHRPG